MLYGFKCVSKWVNYIRWEIYMLKYMVSYIIKVLTIWEEGLKCMMICKDVMMTWLGLRASVFFSNWLSKVYRMFYLTVP
jgi:hypothetical protein